MHIVEIVFWLSLIILFYTYFGYPVFIFAVSRLFPKRVLKQEYFPSVTFIISAFNEEKVIESKLKETLQLDYPLEKLEIIVASDGSTDKTEEIVTNFRSPLVRLIKSKKRMGKTNVQNIAADYAKGEIIIFTDATTRLQKDSVEKIVRNFADPSVGCVAGKLIFKDVKDTEESRHMHEKDLIMAYEQLVRNFESVAKTTFGVSGSLYASRKNLYKPLPLDVASDFTLPLEIISIGYRVILEDEAKCYEEPPADRKEEFKRKIRTSSRGIYSLFKMKRLLNPFQYKTISPMLFSHKVLRWLGFYFMLILLVSNIIIYEIFLIYKIFLYFQLFFYFLVLLCLLAGDKIKLRILRIPFNFFMLNFSSFIGMINLLRGKVIVTWDTSR